MPSKFICTVHDDAINSLEEALDEVDVIEIHHNIHNAIASIKEAKQMGINMENGLTKRKNEVIDLERTIEDLEKSLELARSDLKDSNDEVEYLSNKLAQCETTE